MYQAANNCLEVLYIKLRHKAEQFLQETRNNSAMYHWYIERNVLGRPAPRDENQKAIFLQQKDSNVDGCKCKPLCHSFCKQLNLQKCFKGNVWKQQSISFAYQHTGFDTAAEDGKVILF